MTKPIGIPSGWEMNGALYLDERWLNSHFACEQPVEMNKPWRSQSAWTYWFDTGNHAIHPEAEC